MRVIPVLDLRGGVAVHARRGERASYRPVESALAPGTADPVTLAAAYRGAGYTELYVADLDAILGTGSHLETIAAIVRTTGMHVLVDAGIRRAADAARLLLAGVRAVVVGSETLAGWAALSELIRETGPERVVFSLDMHHSRILAASPEVAFGSPAQVLAAAGDCGVHHAVLLQLAAVGSEAGPPLVLAEHLVQALPGLSLLVGGGVRDHADLLRLEQAGAAGALVGTALHSGRLGTTAAV